MKKVKEWVSNNLGMVGTVCVLIACVILVLSTRTNALSNASILRMLELHSEQHGNQFKDCESCSFAFAVRPAVVPIEDTYDSPKE